MLRGPFLDRSWMAQNPDYDSSDIVMLGLPFDGTVSYRPGSRFAPEQIRLASWGLEEYSPIFDRELEDVNFHDAGDLEFPLGNTYKTLEQIENGTAPRIPQSDDFSMAPMLDKEMSKIDWDNKSAIEIKNLVRGLDPIMGTYSYLDGKKIKIWKVDVIPNDNSNVENGTVIKADCKDGLYIKAKDGIIKVLEIQGENAKRMSVRDFLRGNNIEVGAKFYK
jgi:hypothetical protein